jgi:hypothetical protein
MIQTAMSFVDSFDNNDIKKAKKVAFHEKITKNIIRLFFDIDIDCDFERVKDMMFDYFGRKCNKFEPIFIKSTGKQAWHVYTNISCSLTYARYIASYFNQYYIDNISKTHDKNDQLCDMKVYRLNGSLRMPNSRKINEKTAEIVNNTYRVQSNSTYKKCLIGNTEDCYYIDMPLHLIDSYIIDEEYYKDTYIEHSDVHLKEL